LTIDPATAPPDAPPALRVAYLINQYPKLSHTFIRREILALERLGVEVHRFAVRGWDDRHTEPADTVEQARTHFLLKAGIGPLVGALLRTALTRPGRFGRALALAWRMARLGERTPAHHLAYLAEACLLVPLLARCGATQLHAHFGTNAAEVAMLTRVLGGPPYSVTVHGSEEFDRPQALGLTEKIRHANLAVAISSYGRSQLFRWAVLADWPKVQVVHCALDAEFFGDAAEPPCEAPRLVCVGRLCEQKGQLLLIEAVAQLAREGVTLDLVLAGEGEMRPYIEAAIARHGLQGHVRITGPITNAQVREELRQARALVMASFAEGLPVVVMEALAIGRPVLSTHITGVPELVRDGVEGWLFEAGSVEAIVGAMRACLAAPADTLARMGQAGRSRALARHHADTEAARLLALWRERKVPA
jgi:colanic acid/amylovoran biosynthesis glycosyltransferase